MSDAMTIQQTRIVAAVKRWIRSSDEDVDGPVVRDAFHNARDLVVRFPEAATYLLSIWYGDDAAPVSTTPPEGARDA